MVLFAVTTFIIFRFGLDRTSLSGSLAAGVLWRRCCSPPCSGSTASSSPSARRAASTRSGWRRSTAASSSPPRPRRCSSTCSSLELIAVPVFALFFLDSAAALLPLISVLLLADLGLAATGTLISSMAVNPAPATCSSRCSCCPDRALMIAATGATGRSRSGRCRHTTGSAPGWRSSAYTM